MTPAPTTIHAGESLSVAEERMHRLGVRHLPVMGDEGVVGVVSERDLTIIDGLRGFDPAVMSVATVMQSPVYVCRLDERVGVVALEMAKRKIGSSVVVDDEELVGIVTTTDLLRYLALLDSAPTESDRGALGELNSFANRELPLLEAELDVLEKSLRGGFSASRQADREARQRARELCEHMLRYHEHEAVLVGRAAAHGAQGSDAELLDQLHSEYREQSKHLKVISQRLSSYETADLAHALLDLLPVFRAQLRARAEVLARMSYSAAQQVPKERESL